MSQTKSLFVLAGAALSLGGAAFGADNAAWSSANADEVRALVAEMVADAQTRSSLLQSGSTAGHDGKFFLASPDGNFRLNIGGQVQFRYIANFVDDDTGTVDDISLGFQTRRTKLSFSGHIFDANLFYEIKGAFDRNGGTGGGNFRLEDAYFGYKWDSGFKVRWGQFKLPFLREEMVSSARQLMVERSVTNEVYNQDYSQGIEASWTGDWLRWMFAFSDGFGSRNTDLGTGLAPVGVSDFAFTGRAEFMLAGDWKQFDDFTSKRGSDFGLMIGAAGHYQKAEDGPTALGFTRAELLAYTADISVEGDGWNLFASFNGQHQDPKNGTGSFNDMGFVLQGGVYLADNFELAARFDMVLPDSDRGAGADNEFSTVTVGGNWYIYGHAAKFSLDVCWYLDETTNTAFGAIGSNPIGSGVGLLTSTEEDQFAIRAQMQLLF